MFSHLLCKTTIRTCTAPFVEEQTFWTSFCAFCGWRCPQFWPFLNTFCSYLSVFTAKVSSRSLQMHRLSLFLWCKQWSDVPRRRPPGFFFCTPPYFSVNTQINQSSSWRQRDLSLARNPPPLLFLRFTADSLSQKNASHPRTSRSQLTFSQDSRGGLIRIWPKLLAKTGQVEMKKSSSNISTDCEEKTCFRSMSFIPF